MSYQDFQMARRLLAEEGLGVHLRASQLALQQEEDETAKATAEEFRRRGLVADSAEDVA